MTLSALSLAAVPRVVTHSQQLLITPKPYPTFSCLQFQRILPLLLAPAIAVLLSPRTAYCGPEFQTSARRTMLPLSIREPGRQSATKQPREFALVSCGGWSQLRLRNFLQKS